MYQVCQEGELVFLKVVIILVFAGYCAFFKRSTETLHASLGHQHAKDAFPQEGTGNLSSHRPNTGIEAATPVKYDQSDFWPVPLRTAMLIPMRRSRLKVPSGQQGLYHCMSRIVGGQFLLGPVEQKEFHRRMWHLADFFCIKIINYSLMSNHYHQFLEVPGYVVLTDEELLEKVTAYYGKGSNEAVILATAFEKGGEQTDSLRDYYLHHMGDISEYQKRLKGGFSSWYNKRKHRKGTLWMERFKSPIIEDVDSARQAVSAYIDLNPVRASLVADPKDYHYCAYAAAVAGDKRCRKGIMRVMDIDDWEAASAQYRILLVQTGSKHVDGKTGAISRELLMQTLEKGGKLSMAEILRLRIRYFSDGQVIGTEAYVEELFQLYKSQFGKRRTTGARPFKGLAPGSLFCLRDLRNAVFS